MGKSDAENEQLRVLVLLGTQYFPPFIDDLAVIGGGCQGLGIACSLGRRGIPVCLIDNEISIARASRFVGHGQPSL